MEQEEYTKEEINWGYIEFIDNQDILDLIKKKPGGIIALLDEACMFPRSTHDTFAQKLYQTFKNHKRFRKPKLARSDFTICHYADNIGKTKVFLRAGQMTELDGRRTEVLGRSASIIYPEKSSFLHGSEKFYVFTSVDNTNTISVPRF